MKLQEISNAILEELRAGFITDDERISLRLIEELIPIKRSEFLIRYLNTTKDYPAEAIQNFTTTVALTLDKFLKTTTEIPIPISTRFGAAIMEIYSPTDLSVYNITFVPFDRLKYCGTDRFMQKIIYSALRENILYLKSANENFKLVTNIGIRGIFDNPVDVPGFDPDTDEYPVNGQMLNYIIQEITSRDGKLLIGLPSDEVNDSDGEVK